MQTKWMKLDLHVVQHLKESYLRTEGKWQQPARVCCPRDMLAPNPALELDSQTAFAGQLITFEEYSMGSPLIPLWTLKFISIF